METSSNIAIAILAAGASTRMGQPKQLLPWGETSLINHVVSTCKATLAKKVIVVLGANSQAIQSQIKDTSISIIVNETWQDGLGKSIACAANCVLHSKEKTDGLLIVLADQPFVTTTYLNAIITRFIAHHQNIVATAYHSGKIGVPVLFGALYFTELSQISGDEGAKSIIKKYRDSVKVMRPNFENFDIDTKTDFERFSK